MAIIQRFVTQRQQRLLQDVKLYGEGKIIGVTHAQLMVQYQQMKHQKPHRRHRNYSMRYQGIMVDIPPVIVITTVHHHLSIIVTAFHIHLCVIVAYQYVFQEVGEFIVLFIFLIALNLVTLWEAVQTIMEPGM